LIQAQPWIDPERPTINCEACELLVPSKAGTPCPRYERRLTPRKTNAVGRAAALTTAGVILYAPAKILLHGSGAGQDGSLPDPVRSTSLPKPTAQFVHSPTISAATPRQS